MKNDFLGRVGFISHNKYFRRQTERFVLKNMWVNHNRLYMSVYLLVIIFTLPVLKTVAEGSPLYGV